MRNQYFLRLPRNFPHFMEPQGSLLSLRKLSFFSILSQINPVQALPSYLGSILILSSYLRRGLPSGLFPSCFSTKPFKHVFSLIHVEYPTNSSISLDLPASPLFFCVFQCYCRHWPRIKSSYRYDQHAIFYIRINFYYRYFNGSPYSEPFFGRCNKYFLAVLEA
jgi:hypothetical protein